MVVVDSSVLIPFAKAGHLKLLNKLGSVSTTEHIQKEVLILQTPEHLALSKAFDEWITVHKVKTVKKLRGLTHADISLLELCVKTQERLLTNDKALIQVAKSMNIPYAWPTTVLFVLVHKKILSASKAKSILYDLSEAGIHIKAPVFAQVIKALESLE